MKLPEISPLQMHEKLKTGDEMALLDVREQGVHAQGHPLFAVPLPLSRLELEAERLLPRKSAPLYLLDQGDTEELARRAALNLLEMGYEKVTLIAGGVLAWHRAGLEIFSGVNVPSKAFGECVETLNGTPHISAEDLQERLSKGEQIPILDSRPYEEYHRMCIPGGIDMPGAELVHRIFDVIEDETTPIIVNCAGRTRSIIGAQSLRNAGIKNPVMALKDGTMGWYLSGFKLEHKADRIASLPNSRSLLKALNAARNFAKKADVNVIDGDKLDELRKTGSQKSIYLLDVRTQEEFENGHLAGSQHSPGGQLVQATDEYVGVRNATLVLIDDQEVRGLMTASWLKQMGWENVGVYSDLAELHLETGGEVSTAVELSPVISVPELDAVLASGEPVAVVDLSTSLDYRERHIPGSYWAIRSRLDQDLKYLPPVGFIILTARDERLAHLAAKEILKLNPQIIVRVLEGGNNAWFEASLPTEEGDNRLLSASDDIWYKPYDNREKIKERMQEYLDWEVALTGQVERDGTARFRVIE